MAVRDEVRALIERLSPDPICDDCVTERLGLSVRQHANHETRELAGTRGFERRKDRCSMCGSEKKVIRFHAK
jgi:ribosomal protein L37E